MSAAALAGPAAARAETGSEAPIGRIALSFAGHAIDTTLFDSPASRALLAMLPLEATIEDYSTNEKIVRLPRKLPGDGATLFSGEAPGDLCYYAPWGNLALFYAGYTYSNGLIRLGRMDGWRDALRVRGTFPVRVARLSPAS